jgi:3-carboxymuconate cyclase
MITAYAGTYADKIFALEIDAERKSLGKLCELAQLAAPSFLTVADGKYLIACSEVEHFEGEYGGGLVSYELLPSKKLRELSRINTGGTITCHVAYDPATRRVAAANYGDGSFAVCTLDENGVLSRPQILVKHTGNGPDALRQAGPHGHQCVFASNGTLWVCDLGLDAAIHYSLENGSARELRRLHTPPGSGARHIAFDKTGEFAYVICEMASFIAVFKLDGGDAPVAVYPLTDGKNTQTGASALKYRASDGLLLATNRFSDNISIYYAENEKLVLLDRIACGRIPRDAAFVPDTELVIAGFQDDSRVVLYDISKHKLKKCGMAELPKPTCFVF